MIFNIIFSTEADETFESIGEQIRARWGEGDVNLSMDTLKDHLFMREALTFLQKHH